jgi:predicted RNase H-like nuclease (RuvC/YqgF family)
VLQAGDQLKATILRQKTAVADLKSQIDKVQDSIHFVEANAYRNGVEYNKLQAQKQLEVQRLQSQLEEQKKNLEQMQETARKAGFGSAIWDP